jgi:V-type H+-transporting ATPase subunit E
LNNSRLKVLRARNDNLEQLFEEARKQVLELGKADKYAQALEKLVLEVSFRFPTPLCLRRRQDKLII